MAHTNKVLRSINTPDGGRCIDIFIRPDGTFGFEEFRRDIEDSSGWFPIGAHGNKKFSTEKAAFQRAKEFFIWIQDPNN
jgi:hypothetical protein